MRTQQVVHGRGRGVRRLLTGALPVAALVMVSACGTEDEPDVEDAGTSAEVTPSDAAPSTADASDPVETTEEPTDDATVTSAPPAPTTAEPTTDDPPAEPTGEDPPPEGAGDALAFAEDYVGAVTEGDTQRAYEMLSPEAMAYYPELSVFEENGIADLSADLAEASGELQWAIRPAYEETQDSAQVVSIWGEGGAGEPFAHAFAVRELDGMSWVVDQDVTPSAGDPRLNWLNPGIAEGVDPWVVNPDQPIQFALLKDAGPNVAVTASIDDGSEVSQQLRELPTDGAVIYELSEDELTDGLHVVTAAWLAEDQPFVHTSATPARNP